MTHLDWYLIQALLITAAAISIAGWGMAWLALKAWKRLKAP